MYILGTLVDCTNSYGANVVYNRLGQPSSFCCHNKINNPVLCQEKELHPISKVFSPLVKQLDFFKFKSSISVLCIVADHSSVRI